MGTQNPNDIARQGHPKRIVEAQPVPGQVRQTKGGLHPYLHGQAAPLDDEKEPPLKSHEKRIPLHPSTPKRIADAVHPIANDPGEILRDAANLGRKA
jgi:hypothetical protein